MSKFDKRVNRIRRHWRVRAKIKGTAARPRLSIYRSNKYISAQLVDDESGRTLAAASTQQKTLQEGLDGKFSSVAAATLVGKTIADKAKGAGLAKICFDRGPYKYHGRVKALADAAREAGLEF